MLIYYIWLNKFVVFEQSIDLLIVLFLIENLFYVSKENVHRLDLLTLRNRGTVDMLLAELLILKTSEIYMHNY